MHFGLRSQILKAFYAIPGSSEQLIDSTVPWTTLRCMKDLEEDSRSWIWEDELINYVYVRAFRRFQTSL